MATVTEPLPRARGRDRFFLYLSLAMCAVIVAGFALNLALGRSSFAVPLIYHVHAAIFFGWVALFMTQNLLVASGAVRIHRALGVLALAWVPMMLVAGVAMMLFSVRDHGGPPFFDLREFLFGNPADLLCFAGLVLTAVAMRGNSPWHRRLMICATAILTGPGFGRLLPTPFLVPWAWIIVGGLTPLIFPLIGIAGDFFRARRVHPAWLWGMGAMIFAHFGAEAIAFTPFGESVTRAVVAGTPGADRDFAAHFP